MTPETEKATQGTTPVMVNKKDKGPKSFDKDQVRKIEFFNLKMYKNQKILIYIKNLKPFSILNL